MNSSVLVKVMIVDDEPLALDDICTIFDWKAGGFDIIAKACNGAEAFEAYKRTNPDVVITDVRMPVMDGIELVKKIRRLNMNTRIIFLTSFEDFGYATEALRLSVKDYLLKYEISEESISKLLLPIRDEIIAEQKNCTLRYSRYITEHFDSNLVVKLDEQCDEKLKQLIDRKYYDILLEECMPLPLIKNFAPDKWPVPAEPEKIMSYCMEYEFHGVKVSCSAILCSCRYIVLIDHVGILSQTGLTEFLREFAQDLVRNLKELSGKGFTAYINPIKLSFDESRAYYKENTNRIYCRYLFGQDKVYSTSGEDSRIALKSLEIDKTVIMRLVKEKKSAELMNILDKIYEKAIKENNYPGFSLAVGTLFGILKSYTSIDSHAMLIKSSDMNEFYDARSLIAFIKGKFAEIINLRSEQGNEHSAYVQKAIDYMSNNYGNPDFSIDQMAFDISLSVVRLEKLFKQNTGKTIIDYLTLLRVRTAKEMLVQGKLKVYEVSDLVGYSSSQYFSKVFKKVVGMSPLDYKLWGNRE